MWQPSADALQLSAAHGIYWAYGLSWACASGASSRHPPWCVCVSSECNVATRCECAWVQVESSRCLCVGGVLATRAQASGKGAWCVPVGSRPRDHWNGLARTGAYFSNWNKPVRTGTYFSELTVYQDWQPFQCLNRPARSSTYFSDFNKPARTGTYFSDWGHMTTVKTSYTYQPWHSIFPVDSKAWHARPSLLGALCPSRCCCVVVCVCVAVTDVQPKPHPLLLTDLYMGAGR